MTFARPAALFIGLALLAGCADGNAGIFASDPEAATNDTLVDETEADDPMNPGAIDDAIGVPM
jgi:hypothetical protein